LPQVIHIVHVLVPEKSLLHYTPHSVIHLNQTRIVFGGVTDQDKNLRFFASQRYRRWRAILLEDTRISIEMMADWQQSGLPLPRENKFRDFSRQI
jgi:hypothetical protein